MPFIKQDLRAPLLAGDIQPQVPGDLCFLEYVKIMEAWKAEPRWTTIHNECRRIFGLDDAHAAKLLAFLEFYARHGHRYEIEKADENGDI